METDELLAIIARDEDSRHQFKADVNNASSLAAEMVAFSNGTGGLMLIGVNDGDGSRSGLTREDIGRINQRHTDLMDVLAGYNNRAFAPLDEIAVLLGFPGKMGMSGSKVWAQYQAGEIKAIRDYCETDALNTYLVYLSWMHTRGQLRDEDLQREHEVVVTALQDGAPHLQEFLQVWQANKLD